MSGAVTTGARRAGAPEEENDGDEEDVRPGAGQLLGAATAELIGVFLLVFAGTGTVLALQRGGDGGDILAVAFAFGLSILIAVYAFGHVSGGHINPAVTIALAVVRKFQWRAVPVYLVAQFAGAVLASLAVWALFGDSARTGSLHLGITAPGQGVSDGTALLAEAIVTFLLLTAVLALGLDDRAEGPAVGLGIGLTIVVAILATGPISGGSLNPARSLGPAVVSGDFDSLWVYFAGPIAGGVLGAVVYDRVIRRGRPPEL